MSQQGDIWAVPPMPRAQRFKQPFALWEAVGLALREGWSGKVEDAHRLAGYDKFNVAVADTAEELGAPVGQMFTALVLRKRREVIP